VHLFRLQQISPKSDSNRSATLVIVLVSRRPASDAVAAFMVDFPVECDVLPSDLMPHACLGSVHAAVGSEDPRKIESSRKILPVRGNSSCGCLNSPGVWLPLGVKMGEKKTVEMKS
jgi:hypothetical protein